MSPRVPIVGELKELGGWDVFWLVLEVIGCKAKMIGMYPKNQRLDPESPKKRTVWSGRCAFWKRESQCLVNIPNCPITWVLGPFFGRCLPKKNIMFMMYLLWFSGCLNHVTVGKSSSRFNTGASINLHDFHCEAVFWQDPSYEDQVLFTLCSDCTRIWVMFGGEMYCSLGCEQKMGVIAGQWQCEGLSLSRKPCNKRIFQTNTHVSWNSKVLHSKAWRTKIIASGCFFWGGGEKSEIQLQVLGVIFSLATWPTFRVSRQFWNGLNWAVLSDEQSWAWILSYFPDQKKMVAAGVEQLGRGC